ncbi:MAG: epoxide hydrolase [Hyphomonadaceae bacterium]|nr:epoxide hydrolase [Hyphomonadaceae bacterium]
MALEPFAFSADQTALDDLKDRLARTRWSPEIGNDDWGYGVSGDYLRDLAGYWRNGFDWRAQEAKINRYSHYRATLSNGQSVHFLRAPGKGPKPIPLILTHGWPWTFWDWGALVGPLSDPAHYGGDPNDAFDVIVPSLPGYGYSTPLTRQGITAPVVADMWRELMRDVLGYDRFAAAGGDWGAFVTWELGTRYIPDLIAIYLSFPPLWHAGGVEGLKPEHYAPNEAGWLEKTHRKWETAIAHLTVHSRDHQTLAWALNDSPIGLAAWLLERRRNWSDCRGDLESRYSRDFLLTNVTLYWLTQSIASSMQLYAEQFRAGAAAADNYTGAQLPARIEAPTGIGVYPEEVALMPRALCEQAANLVYWNVLPEGGHFAPAEVPETYLSELRTHFRAFR